MWKMDPISGCDIRRCVYITAQRQYIAVQKIHAPLKYLPCIITLAHCELCILTLRLTLFRLFESKLTGLKSGEGDGWFRGTQTLNK